MEIIKLHELCQLRKRMKTTPVNSMEINPAQFKKSRLVPVHFSTAKALEEYKL
jgi:hypothetical protein